MSLNVSTLDIIRFLPTSIVFLEARATTNSFCEMLDGAWSN